MQKRYCWGCMQLVEEDVCPYCGYEMQDKIDSTMYLAPGTQLGKYLIGRVLGQGGFGITYLAYDMVLNLKVAIKEYLPKPLTEEELSTIVKEVVSEVGATTMKDMGKVMSVVSQRVNGRADGSIISKMVRSILA